MRAFALNNFALIDMDMVDVFLTNNRPWIWRYWHWMEKIIESALRRIRWISSVLMSAHFARILRGEPWISNIERQFLCITIANLQRFWLLFSISCLPRDASDRVGLFFHFSKFGKLIFFIQDNAQSQHEYNRHFRNFIPPLTCCEDRFHRSSLELRQVSLSGPEEVIKDVKCSMSVTKCHLDLWLEFRLQNSLVSMCFACSLPLRHSLRLPKNWQLLTRYDADQCTFRFGHILNRRFKPCRIAVPMPPNERPQ